jgi:hypothetical protein
VRIGGVLLWVLALGCSATATKAHAPAEGPSGCCCVLKDCREGFTQSACAQEGTFRGWTYQWYEGACSAQDRR